MIRRLSRILGLFACLLLAVPALAQPRPPLVLAAASLQEALNAAADAWAAKGHPRPILSFAASSALARQVVAGAPADLFLSADEAWMDQLAAAGRIRPGTRQDFAGNTLVLIAPAGRPRRFAVRPGIPLAAALAADRGEGGRLATGAMDSVPAGRYARQALTRLGVWPQVSGRIAGAESVRAALALVARGEAPLGIVYATDAKAEPRVMVAGIFPEASHEPIRYPLALLKTTTSPDAEPFRRFLLGAETRAILLRYGFRR